MAMIKSIAAGTGASLLLANATSRSGDGGSLMIVSTTVGGHRLAWSWLVFAVVTVVVWLLAVTLDHSAPR